MSDKNVFALELKDNKKVIGSLGLHGSWADKDEKYCDIKLKKIGYVLSKMYWGQGLMPEAVSAITDYCFNTLCLDALTVEHFPQNNQSKRVIQKNGFIYIGQGGHFAKGLNKTFIEDRYILHRR